MVGQCVFLRDSDQVRIIDTGILVGSGCHLDGRGFGQETRFHIHQLSSHLLFLDKCLVGAALMIIVLTRHEQKIAIVAIGQGGRKKRCVRIIMVMLF